MPTGWDATCQRAVCTSLLHLGDASSFTRHGRRAACFCPPASATTAAVSHLLVFRHVLERAHIVQPVRELDESHAPLRRHCDQQRALIVDLVGPGSVGNAGDNGGDRLTEQGSNVVSCVRAHIAEEAHEATSEKGRTDEEEKA